MSFVWIFGELVGKYYTVVSSKWVITYTDKLGILGL